MGLLLRLGPNVITDGTFITLGSSYYTCAFYLSVCINAQGLTVQSALSKMDSFGTGTSCPS